MQFSYSSYFSLQRFAMQFGPPFSAISLVALFGYIISTPSKSSASKANKKRRWNTNAMNLQGRYQMLTAQHFSILESPQPLSPHWCIAPLFVRRTRIWLARFWSVNAIDSVIWFTSFQFLKISSAELSEKWTFKQVYMALICAIFMVNAYIWVFSF